MDWICDRVSYLEHNSHAGKRCSAVPKGCYWPQRMGPDLNPCDTALEEYSNMDLIDYIDAMIALEKEPK